MGACRKSAARKYSGDIVDMGQFSVRWLYGEGSDDPSVLRVRMERFYSVWAFKPIIIGFYGSM